MIKNNILKHKQRYANACASGGTGGTGGTDDGTTTAGCPNVTCSSTAGVGEGDYCANDNKFGT